MKLSGQIAKHVRDLHFGGNWTCVDLKNTLADVTWQEAAAKLHSLNTIATLVYHMNYYVSAVSEVLQGRALNSNDKLSFEHSPVTSAQDWDAMLDKTWADAKTFVSLIEQLDDDTLWQTFTNEKYGTYYRNLQGIIEHTHYHLGQIVLIKKLLRQA